MDTLLPQAPLSAEQAGFSPRAAAASAGRYGPDVVFYYLSDLLDSRVRFEDEARPWGRLRDIGAALNSPYPLAVCIEIKSRAGTRVLPWSAVRSLAPRETVLRRGTPPAPPAAFWGQRDVLDDQVLDVSGARVLRVNDVHLAYSEGNLLFAHVETGVLGILRRLRFEQPIGFLARWLFDYSIQESFVTWRRLEVLAPAGAHSGLRLSALPQRLAEMHPGDLADIMEQLGAEDRQRIFDALSVEDAADALEEVLPEYQRTLVSQEEPDRAADILEEMPSLEAADVLRDLGPDAQTIISRMERDAAHEVRAILAHEEESAGGVMSSACIEARPGESADEVLSRIHKTADEVEVLNMVYVLDEQGRLVGVLSLKELLRAAPEATIQSLMNAAPVAVTPATPLHDVAALFVKHGFRALPVVESNNVFLGAVPFKRALSELAPMVKE